MRGGGRYVCGRARIFPAQLDVRSIKEFVNLSCPGNHPRVRIVPGLRAMRIAIASIATLLVLVAPVLAKRKDDVVVMKNGDRLTGEIKRLEEGKLIFSASYIASDVVLDWTNVERLESR